MKTKLLYFFTFISFLGYAQQDAWVYFNDKPNSNYYFNNPLQMLSQRALDRRTNQNIALDFKDVPLHQPYVDQITAAAGIQVKAKSKWLNCLHVRGSQTDISTLISLPFVNHISFADKGITQLGRHTTVTHSGIKSIDDQPVTTFNYGTSASQIQMLNGHLLHQQNYTGTGKIIAVLDAGFPGVDVVQPFQRLRDNNLILGGYNFVDKTTNFYTRNGHGTSVLSCIGGFKDNQLVGTAPDAKFYLFITEDVDSENPVEESNWVEAAEMADYVGADIITSSLGYFGYDNPSYSYLYEDMTGNKAFASRGANIAFSKGIVVVVSAGNSGGSADPHIGVPADATNVLTIGAVKSDRTKAGFSSIGPSFDNRVKPDVMAQGQSSVVSNSSGSITTANGTSFSCPIMAGMIASFWQAIPWATNAQIVQFVKQASDNYATPNANYGYGIPNFQTALNIALLNVPLIPFKESEFSFAPNPVLNQLELKFPESYKNNYFDIYNNLGQLILSNENVKSNQNIDLSTLSSGFYFFKFSSSEAINTGKLLKK